VGIARAGSSPAFGTKKIEKDNHRWCLSFWHLICSASDAGFVLLAGALLDLLLASNYNAPPDVGWRKQFCELPRSAR
jgi:hypothetical protein